MIDRGFTSPREKRDFWPLIRLLLIVGVVLTGGRFALRYLDRDTYLLNKQHANHERVAFYVEALRDYREWSGSFPANLVDSIDPSDIPGGIARGVPLRDAWDNPLRYFSDGSIYLLVSVGRDGEPDGDEYYELRKPGAPGDICGQPDADVVVSDLGWHTQCRPGS